MLNLMKEDYVARQHVLSTVAIVVSILASVIVVYGFIDARSGARAVLGEQVRTLRTDLASNTKDLKDCDADHEARIRLLEEAYREQKPIMDALREHFHLEVDPRNAGTGGR